MTAKIEIVDILGRVIYTDVTTITNGNIDKRISVPDDLPNGEYIVRLKNEEVNTVIRFILDR